MPGDLVIERISLSGIFSGMHPLVQQAIFGLIFIFVALIIPTRLLLLGLVSFVLGIFLVLDIIVSKTFGWEKVLGG